MEELTARAQTGYACELPGFGIRFDNFVPVMQRAVSTGWVTPADAAFVYDGLRDGFKLGVDIARLHGHRWFKNYESALGAEDAVSPRRCPRGLPLVRHSTWESGMQVWRMSSGQAALPVSSFRWARFRRVRLSRGRTDQSLTTVGRASMGPSTRLRWRRCVTR